MLAGLVLLALGACRARPAPRRGPRLVLLYATCTVNRDFLSPYSPRVRYTPNLARFASQGRVFLRHQTEEGQSGPAFASLLTGTQADRHGVFVHPARLDPSNTLITEAFAREGYRTLFWDSHPIVNAELDYAQGVAPHRIVRDMLTDRDPQFVRQFASLRERPDLRVFIATAFTVTHGAYRLERVGPFCERHPEACGGLPTAEILRFGELYHRHRLSLERNYEETVRRLGLSPSDRRRMATALDAVYASRIEYLDEAFGAVVDAVDAAGLRNDSLIVFTADHGEVLFRENAPFKWTHGYMLTPEDLSPPLIVRGAGLEPGRYEGVSRSIDVFPTMASLAGLTLPAGTVDGVDLAPALRSATPPPDLTAFSHTMLIPHAVYERSRPFTLFRSFFRELDASGMWVAARRGDLFYRVRNQLGRDLPPELYDLGSDPGLTHNLFDPKNERDARMHADLMAYKRRLVEAHARRSSAATALSAGEERDRLRQLGYIDP